MASVTVESLSLEEFFFSSVTLTSLTVESLPLEEFFFSSVTVESVESFASASFALVTFDLVTLASVTVDSLESSFPSVTVDSLESSFPSVTVESCLPSDRSSPSQINSIWSSTRLFFGMRCLVSFFLFLFSTMSDCNDSDGFRFPRIEPELSFKSLDDRSVSP